MRFPSLASQLIIGFCGVVLASGPAVLPASGQNSDQNTEQIAPRVQAQPSAWSTSDGTVKFYADVPLHDFTGTSNELTGQIDLDDGTVEFFVEIATLDTGNGKRNRDMLKTFDTENHPRITFTGVIEGTVDMSSTTAQPVTAVGQLAMRGVSQDVRVDGTLQPSDSGLLLRASWIVNMKDYRVKPPRILFVKVKDEQDIEIEALLRPESL